MEVLDTDVLVVGAGPAGLTASALLARAGVKAIGVTKYPGTADSPRRAPRTTCGSREGSRLCVR